MTIENRNLFHSNSEAMEKGETSKKLAKLKIGDVLLENSYVLAPMAGVSDLPYRLLCHQQGVGLAATEMVSAKAIMHNNKNTKKLLQIHPEEGHVSLQLFGANPQIISEMAKRIEELPFSVLDINMGCPMPKIFNNGEGAALMKSPKLVHDIVYATSRAIKKPVTVKIRKGLNDDHVNGVEIAKIAEAAGAAAVAVHGRTREQYYTGYADWNIIRQVKEALSIPVIGNGDVNSGPKAKAMKEETGVDGVMVARGAQGNPWIFSELIEYEQTGKVPDRPTKAKMIEMILKHARLLIECKGEYTGIREMRKHVAWYTKGYHGSARLRNEVNKIETYEGLENILTEL